MGDSICKWRAARPHNVVEMVNWLPHESMPEATFRDIMEQKVPGFFHTPYQLACQLALYYIDEDNIYHPRFDHDIDELEAENYLKLLVKKYYVPNPYTARGFSNLDKPIVLESTLVEYLESHGGKADFEQALSFVIKEAPGNVSATKTLLSYSQLLNIQGDNISLQPNYKELMEMPVNRKDKSAFFHVFNQQLKSRKVDGLLQLVYFGAPGTGKSHRIKQVCSEYEHYRITFHPDTDYASFVGSYKPITHTEQVYTNMGDKAIPLKDSISGEPVITTKITYQYVFQAFLNAYIAAWREQQSQNPRPVFLIIEEINRGNCAQIFGDIFQLLDRNEAGYSDYPIISDNDLRKELGKEFKNFEFANSEAINGIYGEDIIAKIKDGSHLLLPNNLYIWATMNTSDQSLFPIDSAFKRRWDWKYVKIADCGKNYRIAVNGNEYDWWEFVNAINSHIGADTDQEDKKLGYFFAKASKNDNGKYIISADTFLSKVIFFIYNDVYKDYGFDDRIFKDANGEDLTFSNYFDLHGDTVHEKVERFILNLGIQPLPLDEIEEKEQDELENEADTSIDGSANKLTIRFPDGTIVRENTRFESYLKALEKIGLDVVEPIAAEKKYTRRNSALISKSESAELLADSVYSYVKSGDFYIVKGTNTRTQKNLLNLVSDRLNLGLIITVE